MDTSEILSLRLTNQQICDTRFRSPHDLVVWLGAVQAQDYASARWSVGLRLSHSTSADIEEAIRDREVVRTWVLRGTLHIVAAEDVRWMLRLMGPRITAKSAGVYRQAGLTDKVFEDGFLLLENALQGEKQLMRSQVVELWENAGITTNNQRGYLMLARAGLEGRICLGPMRDKQQTFVLLDEWIPHTKEFTREESLVEIGKRFFASHGPATIEDFMWWCGCTRSDARQTIDMLARRLIQVSIEEKEYLYIPHNFKTTKQTNNTFLLPGFDEYLLGYTDRSLIIKETHRHQIYPKNAVYPGLIIIKGRVRGIWKRTIEKSGIHIKLSPFTKLDDKEKSEIDEVCATYGRFWKEPVVVSVS